MGPHAHNLLASYCKPKTLKEMTFKELNAVLTTKLAPVSRNYVNEQYKFNLIKQEATESLSMYMARIKDAASYCKFGTEYDNMVRNRFITGLRDIKIRTGLLDQAVNLKEEEVISSEDILMKAIAKETANNSTFQGGSSSAYVVSNSVQKRKWKSHGQKKPNTNNNNNRQNFNNNRQKCEQCTLTGHTKDKCFTTCRYCRAKGHIVKHCRKAQLKNTTSQHHVDQDDGTRESEDYGYDEQSERLVHNVSQPEGMLNVNFANNYADISICGTNKQVFNVSCDKNSNFDKCNLSLGQSAEICLLESIIY